MKRNIRLVPVVLDNGATIKVDANSIKENDKKVHHGKAPDGSQVNSAKTFSIGKSTLIYSGAGAISMPTSDFKVLSLSAIQEEGGQVKMPEGNKLATA